MNALYEWNKNVLLLGVDKIGYSFYDKKVGKNTGNKEISKYKQLLTMPERMDNQKYAMQKHQQEKLKKKNWNKN